MRTSSAGPRITALAVTVTVLVAGFGVRPEQADAYLFFGDRGYLGQKGEHPPTSEDAVRWAPDVWGPGETLEWWIEDGPHWRETGHAPAEMIPGVQKSLEDWSTVTTADIRWRVAGVTAGPGTAALDGRNSIFIDATSDHAGERVWRRGGGIGGDYSERLIVECDIPIAPDHVRSTVEQGNWGREHGLGHCLGLAHTAAFPVWRSNDDATGRWPFTDLWPAADSAMSYGANSNRGVHPDDMLGASLLRPRPGWRATTGNMAGRVVFADGSPVPYAYVWAIPVSGSSMRGGVGAFSRLDGRFMIEGLPPGEYALWAHPILSRRAFGGSYMPDDELVLAVDDAIWPHAISVSARRTTDGVAIRMNRGRRAAPFTPDRPAIVW